MRATSPVRRSLLVPRPAADSTPGGSTHSCSSTPSSGGSSPLYPAVSGRSLHPAIAEERLQGLLDLAQVSGEGMSAALSRLENERDELTEKQAHDAAVIARQRGELERSSVVVQANQQRTVALRQALQLAEQQQAVRRDGPQLAQAVREELATALRRRRARAWALRRWSVRAREAELMALSQRSTPPHPPPSHAHHFPPPAYPHHCHPAGPR